MAIRMRCTRCPREISQARLVNGATTCGHCKGKASEGRRRGNAVRWTEEEINRAKTRKSK